MASERILIVDDEDGMRRLLSRVLSREGYETTTVASGAEALRQVAGERFDLVFLDPPFGADLNEDLCRLLEERKVVAGDAQVYIEQDRSKPEPALPSTWRVRKNQTTGNVRYMLVQRGD